MFLGEYHTGFTGHSRVVLPKKFRQELAGNLTIILSRGFEGCIWGFAQSSWEKEASRQLEGLITEKGSRDVRRYLFSGAESVALDAQGRFVIPSMLLEYAHLKEEVVIIGAGDHFEIWNPDLWEKALKELTAD